MTLRLGGDPSGDGPPRPAVPEPVDGLDGASNDRHGTISPDGLWLAYESDGFGGRFEIFVRPFPDTAASVWQISQRGGQQPHWSADGRELYYLAPDGALTAVPVDSRDGRPFEAGTPTRLFAGDYVLRGGGHVGRHYDAAADGRFLMVKEDANRQDLAQIVVVRNWPEELQRLLPERTEQ